MLDSKPLQKDSTLSTSDSFPPKPPKLTVPWRQNELANTSAELFNPFGAHNVAPPTPFMAPTLFLAFVSHLQVLSSQFHRPVHLGRIGSHHPHPFHGCRTGSILLVLNSDRVPPWAVLVERLFRTVHQIIALIEALVVYLLVGFWQCINLGVPDIVSAWNLLIECQCSGCSDRASVWNLLMKYQ